MSGRLDSLLPCTQKQLTPRVIDPNRGDEKERPDIKRLLLSGCQTVACTEA